MLSCGHFLFLRVIFEVADTRVGFRASGVLDRLVGFGEALFGDLFLGAGVLEV